MANLLYSLVYIFLIFLLGWLFVYRFFRKEINFLEHLGMSLGAGMLFNYLAMVVSTILKLKLVRPVIWAELIGMVIILLGFTNFKKLLEYLRTQYEAAKKIKIWQWLVIGTLLLAITAWFAWINIAEGFWYGDEFSFWGRAVRMIFNLKTLRIQNSVFVDFAGYPLLWPANLAGLSLVTNQLIENYLKFFNVGILLSLGTFFFGYLKRLNLNIWERSVACLFIFASGFMMVLFTSVIYADLAFLYTYAVGTSLLLATKGKKNYTLLLAVLTFFAAAINIRVNGILLVFISLFSMAIFYLKDRDYLRDIISIAGLVVFLQFLWTSFVATSKTSAALPYARQLFGNLPYIKENLFLVLNKMVQSLFFPNTLVDGWGIFWWLVIPILIAAPLVYKKVESRIIILNVSLNFLFLLAVYLFVFKKEEMMTIASFPRYVMGFTPIAILGVAYFYKFTKEWALSGK